MENKDFEIMKTLEKLWPDGGTLLKHTTCFQLLVSVILSAQCTDEQVNKTTPSLFERWPDALSMSKAKLEDVENAVKTCGFYHNKAKNIIATSKMIIENFEGKVPDTIEKLVSLPGVGRKTANLIVSVGYGKPGLVVDTHVLRVCKRIGFSLNDDAKKTEKILASIYPEEEWNAMSYAINRQGKFICKARKPLCCDCKITNYCNYFLRNNSH